MNNQNKNGAKFQQVAEERRILADISIVAT
jgi:hypothetical protein